MPVVAFALDDLNRRLGAELTAERLEELLDQMGCDIEEFTRIRRIRCGRCGALQELTRLEDHPVRCPECNAESGTAELWEAVGEVDVVRMDLLPIRPDLFDPGGITRAMKGLMGTEVGLRPWSSSPSDLSVVVEESVLLPTGYRPFIRCAVVRGLNLDEVGLRLLMKLQENIHWALGRDRKLASIGVYDLTTIHGPVTYRSVAPEELEFVPLQTADGKALTPRAVLEEHPKGIAYAHHLAELEGYPLLVDAEGQVLSMPPIINSHGTRLTLDTTDVFIDVTGITERAVNKSLHTVVTSLVDLFPGSSIETVAIEYPSGTVVTPTLETEAFTVSVPRAARLIGIDLDMEGAAGLLTAMRHRVIAADDEHLDVTVACYRNDIMHEVDLIEDIAIAYGFHNVKPDLVGTMTLPAERPERVLANRARTILAGLGFHETMSLLLTNPAEAFELLGREEREDVVLLENPISVEQTMLRVSLLPQLLKLFAVNRGQGLPQRLFEIDDTVTLVEGKEEPRESLHLAVGVLDSEVGFADIRSTLDALGRELGLGLALRQADQPGFIPGRAAELLVDDESAGVMGEVHPEVLEKLRLTQPLVAMELTLVREL